MLRLVVLTVLFMVEILVFWLGVDLYMARKGESIFKRSDGRYEARFISSYDENGKAIYKSVYAKTYTEAKNKRRDKMHTISNERQKTSVNMLFKDICLQWLETKQKESTYSKYHTDIHNHIIPKLGHFKINQISSNIINDFIKEKLKNGRLDGKGGLSPKTVRDLTISVISIIKYGDNKNYIINFNYEKIEKIKEPKKPIQILKPAEHEQLTCYLKSNIDFDTLGILITLFTGLRIGELCALKIKDISFKNDVISITKTMQRIKNTEPNAKTKTKIVITEPKTTESIRDIPIPSFLKDIIKTVLFGCSKNAYVSTGKCNKFIEPRSFENKLTKILKDLKIPHYKFHALRHTFATNAINQGMDIKTLSTILGHANVSFTLERYVHPSHGTKKADMDKMAACF